MSEQPDWEGLPESTHEHRTVGPHRAWCYVDTEWCYPDNLCWGCDQIRVPGRWRGDHVGYVLADIRARVEALGVEHPDVVYNAAVTDMLALLENGGSP